MKCKNIYILLAFICLVMTLGAQANSCDPYILGPEDPGIGNSWQEKMEFMKFNSILSPSDVVNEHARPFRYFDFHLAEIPAEKKYYIIKVYGVPFSENGKEYIYYQKFMTVERERIPLEDGAILEKMEYELFEKTALEHFVSNYVDVNQIVFYPEENSNGLLFKPYVVNRVHSDKLELQDYVTGGRKVVSLNKLFYHSISMLQEYNFLRNFYLGGGRGKVVRYKTVFSKIYIKNDYDASSSHNSERHYIAVEKMPGADTKFEHTQFYVNSNAVREKIHELIAQGKKIFIHATNNDWRALTAVRETSFAQDLLSTIGNENDKVAMIFKANLDLKTVVHEDQHFEDNTKPNFVSDLLSKISDISNQTEIKNTLYQFILEYRGYNAADAILQEAGEQHTATKYLKYFQELYVEPLEKILNNNRDIDKYKLSELLNEYCQPSETFSLKAVFNHDR
ncbi:MAG: hypothetical protein JNM93_02495 [Bacteriovoracaceae bacterium]|nr:hypothetical protein [Bacteriovoracaceae bacterium]